MKLELKVISGSRSGLTIPITIPQFMIGRAEDCQLKPKSELISRYHCAILSEPSYVAVRDLGSKNGVYVNGERIGVEQELKNGDRLAIGPLEFLVVLTSDAPKPQPVQPAPAPETPRENVADVVARIVAQNSARHVAHHPAPQPAAPAPQPAAPAPQPAAPAPQPAAPAPQAAAPAPQPAAPAPQPAAPAPQPAAPAPQPAAPAPQAAAPAPQAAAPASKPAAPAKPSSGDAEEDLADWLLGDDDDDVSEETATIQTALDDLDLPYTPQEAKTEEPKQEKPRNAVPNSSDAAANLLKNFFKGGR